MKAYFDLKGRTAIITGCSTGLGVQMAKALANQGANIVALARRQDKIEAVANEIKEQFGVETLAVKCDITDTEAVKAAVKKVLDHFKRIDILINNTNLADETTPMMIENGEKTVLRCAEKMGVKRVITAGKTDILNRCRLQTPLLSIERYMVPEWMVFQE